MSYETQSLPVFFFVLYKVLLCFVFFLSFLFFFFFWKTCGRFSVLFTYSCFFFSLDTKKNINESCMYLFSQPFFQTPHKTLKFQEKSETVRKKYWRKVRKSVGNAFSSDVGQEFKKIFLLVPTMGASHGDSELSKQ